MNNLYRDIKVQFELPEYAGVRTSSFEKELIMAETDDGYTPIKLGTLIDFNANRMHDFYIEAYLEPTEIMYDIFHWSDRAELYIVGTKEGIRTRLYSLDDTSSVESKLELARKSAPVFLSRIETIMWAKFVERIRKAKETEG